MFCRVDKLSPTSDAPSSGSLRWLHLSSKICYSCRIPDRNPGRGHLKWERACQPRKTLGNTSRHPNVLEMCYKLSGMVNGSPMGLTKSKLIFAWLFRTNIGFDPSIRGWASILLPHIGLKISTYLLINVLILEQKKYAPPPPNTSSENKNHEKLSKNVSE